MIVRAHVITSKNRRMTRRARRRTIGTIVATPVVALVGLAGLGAIVGTAPQQGATERIVQVSNASTDWIPSWIDGARCTVGEAREFGVSVNNCVNLVGTRQTITLTNDGVIKVHYS
jgi:hypothetical protein